MANVTEQRRSFDALYFNWQRNLLDEQSYIPFIDGTEDFCFTVALAVNLLVIAGFRADGGLFSVKRMCCVNESMLSTNR